MGELSNLPNIGKTVEGQLIRVGISTADELRKISAKNAWLKTQKIDESACVNRLMAIQGVKNSMLSDEVKADLKAFYQSNKL